MKHCQEQVRQEDDEKLALILEGKSYICDLCVTCREEQVAVDSESEMVDVNFHFLPRF